MGFLHFKSKSFGGGKEGASVAVGEPVQERPTVPVNEKGFVTDPAYAHRAHGGHQGSQFEGMVGQTPTGNLVPIQGFSRR